MPFITNRFPGDYPIKYWYVELPAGGYPLSAKGGQDMSKPKKPKTFFLTAIIILALLISATAASFASASDTAVYTVVKGDSLYLVSQAFHTTVDSLMKLNNLKNYNLNIGQTLTVPGQMYTVQKGDTLFLIAKRFNITLAELRRANNIYIDYLDIGQRLVLPITAPATQPPVNQTPSEPDYSAADLDLLARLIMAEAQGESYQAKVAVGAVVLNRVESDDWPDTINEVINQKIGGYYQFTPVVNGWINNPANTDSINAAKEALNGADPTSGAIWYYDDSTTNTFMLSKKVSIKIGHMVFAF